jgi:murein DD-endopeptidase MepM/ murein hydrolase activator NlpD
MFKRNPLENMVITDGFGPRLKHPVTGLPAFHNGIDLRGRTGTPIYAVADGFAALSKTNNGGAHKGLGHYLVTEHDGFCMVFAHLRSLHLKTGAKFKTGDIIGYVGATGAIKGEHLHLEMRKGKYAPTFWNRDASGRYLNAMDPTEHIIRHIDIETVVARVAKRGIINSPMYWLDVIDGKYPPQKEYVEALFRNIADIL